MITVATFSFPYEAHIARAKLESEGIPAFVVDEHTINAQWLYSQAMGGVRVQVPNEHAYRASEILETDYSGVLEEQEGIDPLVCPNCGSTKVEQILQGKKMAFIAFLFLGFPLWRYKYLVRCASCGADSEYEK